MNVGKVALSRRLRQQVICVEQLYDGGVIQSAVTSVQTGDVSSFLSGKLVCSGRSLGDFAARPTNVSV